MFLTAILRTYKHKYHHLQHALPVNGILFSLYLFAILFHVFVEDLCISHYQNIPCEKESIIPRGKLGMGKIIICFMCHGLAVTSSASLHWLGAEP